MSSPIRTQPEGPRERRLELDAFRGPSRLERAVLPFVREPTLWPILLVLVAHVVVFVAPLLVVAWRDGGGWAIAGLCVTGALSATASVLEIRDRRRPGSITALLAVVWLLCGAGAWAGVWAGIL